MYRPALIGLAVLTVAGLAAAESAPAAVQATENASIAQRLVDQIRSHLGAPSPSLGDAVVLARQISEVLSLQDLPPSAALARIRTIVGAPAASPSSEDTQTLTFIRDMVNSVASPTKVPEIATAQLPVAPKSHPNPNVLERSYMFFGLHGLIFEAQIAPVIFFYDNFEKLYGQDQRARPWAWAWSFTPMIRLRNRSDQSAPIKTLSWMPKTDLQFVSRSPLHEDEAHRFTASTLTLHGTLGHHSNGQDECIYLPGLLDREDLCPVPVRREEVRINYPNGSFSTNYVKVGAVKRWIDMRRHRDRLDPSQEHLIIRQSVSAGLYVEVNPPWLKIGGTLDPVLRPLYGTNRLHGVFEFERRVGPLFGGGWRSGSLRLTTWGSYIDKIPPGVKATFTTQRDAPLNELYSPGDGSSRWRFGAEAAFNPDWGRGWGFDVRYQRGQDYYNLLFIRDISWVQIGLVWDAAEFEPFKILRGASRRQVGEGR